MERTKLLSRMLDRMYDELEAYAGAEIKNAECLNSIDKLTHTIKSITTVLAMEGYDDGSSGARNWNGYNARMYQPYRNRSSGNGSGYESGRSMGTDDEFVNRLMEVKSMAPDEQTAQAIQRMINERR